MDFTLPLLPRERRSETSFLAVASMYRQLSPYDDCWLKNRKNGNIHGKFAIENTTECTVTL